MVDNRDDIIALLPVCSEVSEEAVLMSKLVRFCVHDHGYGRGFDQLSWFFFVAEKNHPSAISFLFANAAMTTLQITMSKFSAVLQSSTQK